MKPLGHALYSLSTLSLLHCGGSYTPPAAPAARSGTEVPLPGYVWLDTPGKVLHVGEHEHEFIDHPPS